MTPTPFIASSLDSNTAEQSELHTISLLGEIVVDSPTLAVLCRHHRQLFMRFSA